VLTCQEHRTQRQNRATALRKLQALVATARVEPKEREQYEGLSARGKSQRRDDKRHKSKVKAARSKWRGKIDF